MKNLNKLIQYFSEYDLYNNMLSNEIEEKKAKDVLLENCDFHFISENMAIQKTENILSALKSKLDMSKRGNVKKLIQSYIADEISLTELFELLPLKSQKFLDPLKSKVDEIKRERSFHLFYPVYLNRQQHVQQPLITFSCELMDDAFQINKLYANKDILALLIAQQKNLEIASVREQYETQINDISSAVDALHKSQSFFDLYQVVCGEFKHVMGEDLAEFRPVEGWQILEKALISFEPPDSIIENCFRDELATLKRYYEKDAILPVTVKHFLALSETKATNIADTNYSGSHLGSYQAEYSINKKQWELVQLSKQSKLLCVEGPPGTGKTTLLKEVIADTLVQKADRLLEVWNEKWTDMGGKTEIKRSPLLGKNLNSIVISSTNNKAINNIGLELLKEIPFFSDFAKTINAEEQNYAGILCARLGRYENIKTFYKLFFQNFYNYLESKTITDEESENARNTYTQLHKKLYSVNQEISELLAYRSQLGSFSSLEEIEKQQAELRAAIESLEGQKSHCNDQISERDEILSQIRNYLDTGRQSLNRVESETKTIEEQLHMLYSDLKIYESIKGLKRFFSFLFPEIRSVKKKYGSSEQIRDTIQEHRNKNQEYQHCLNEIHREMGEKKSKQDTVTGEVATLKSTLLKTEAELIEVSQKYNLLTSYFNQISLLGKREDFTGLNLLSADDSQLRNMPAIMKLRNELFLASLRLFEAYIIMNKEPILHNLKIILTEQDDSGGGTAYYNWCSALYNGDEPYQEDKASLVRILWETFFLCFPVVTTTLHSFRKSTFPLVPDLFDLLMLDESGQILPYYVVAPLYRARRAVFVGDVNQIEPIRNVPAKMLKTRYSELLGSKCYSRFCIDSASAQSYASLASAYYESIGKKVGGIILNEHRRCEPSIMAFSNEHIYLEVLDIIGEDNHNKLFGKNLVAFDVRGFKAKEHYNQSEIDACKQIVNLLIQEYGEDVKQHIGIITPFSRQAAKLKEAIPGIEIGTVHVFQGDEKEFILFSSVVDSTSNMEGLYHFIGSKGNLLNVAFSRAKKQFIYVGNLQAARNADNYLKLAMETLTKYGRIFSLFDTHQLTDNSFLEDSNIIRILTGGRSGDIDDEIGNYLQKMIPKNIIDTPRMHNEILNEVLLLSKTSMHIISPWIGSNVVTESMLDTIRNKIHDGVQIHVVFGHKAVRCSLEDIDELVKKDVPWRKEDAANVIRSLKELLGDMLQFSPPSHVKLLLVDDRYLFIGSLNWLFNSGRTDQKEISCLVTNPDTITYVKDRFLMKN